MRLVNVSTGEAVVGRCRATNLCRYCQLLYVLETVEMLLLDAAEHAPTLWAVLTAREHLTRRETYRHLEVLRRAVRRRWPAAEWFVQVEFQRRGALHLNLLVKGVPVEDREALGELLATRWCARVDAEPVGQWVGEVGSAGGIVKYLAKTLGHGLKAEQAPPLGWRGHRTSQTRGYLVRPASVMREEARASRRLKRALRSALEAGLDAYDAELVAHETVANPPTWRLVHLDLKVGPVRPRRGVETTSAPRPTLQAQPVSVAGIRPYGSGGVAAAGDLVADVDRAVPPPPPTQLLSPIRPGPPAERELLPIGALPPGPGASVRPPQASPRGIHTARGPDLQGT